MQNHTTYSRSMQHTSSHIASANRIAKMFSLSQVWACKGFYLVSCDECLDDYVKWIKLFYHNTKSCILNKSLSGDFFKLEEGLDKATPFLRTSLFFASKF